MNNNSAYTIQLFSAIETLRELYAKRYREVTISSLSEKEKKYYHDVIRTESNSIREEMLPTMEAIQAAYDRYHELRNQLIQLQVTKGTPTSYTVMY